MAYVLSKRSLGNLEGVHPDLVKVAKRAIEITNQDFVIIAGVRTAAEQNALYQQGRTKSGNIVTYRDGYKKKSNHQPKSDGYGHAIDVVPYPVDWNDSTKFHRIADAMKSAANELGVKIEWGGDWKGSWDTPHFELA